MKRLLILLILLIASTSWAQCTEDTQMARLSPAIVGGGVPAVGGPPVAIFDNTGLTKTFEDEVSADGHIIGVRFTIASQKTIYSYKVVLSDLGGAGSAIMYLAEDAAGPDIGATVADTTVTVGHADITNYPTTETQEFVLTTPKVLSAGTYWVCMKRSTGSGSFYPLGFLAYAGYYSKFGGGSVSENYTFLMGVWEQ